MRLKIFVFAAAFFIVGWGHFASAEEEGTSETSAPKSRNIAKKKGKSTSAPAKETEGTKASNRFDSDTIIKSKYELNGQSLEVDTD